MTDPELWIGRAELVEQRDTARHFAAELEAENATLTQLRARHAAQRERWRAALLLLQVTNDAAIAELDLDPPPAAA